MDDLSKCPCYYRYQHSTIGPENLLSLILRQHTAYFLTDPTLYPHSNIFTSYNGPR